MSDCKGCKGSKHFLLHDVSDTQHSIMRCPICNVAKANEDSIIWKGDSYEQAMEEFHRVKHKARLESHNLSEVQ